MNARNEIVIKWPLKRLGNGGVQWQAPEIPGYVFTHDPACADYDWLVVYDEFPFGSGGTIRNGVERLRCPRSHTLLLTQEPVCLKYYGKAYTHQFGQLLTTRPWEAEKHTHYHFGRGYYIPCVGKSLDDCRRSPGEKTRLISAVCSAKAMKHTQHWQRCSLVRYLAGAIQDFDWFGYGVKFIDRKCDGLDAYKYHVAMENIILPGHWTEKISDALLCECLPFYAGDPDVGKVLPPASFIPIPLDNPREAERIIRAAIADNEYEKRLPAIREAKRLILEKYNTFQQIVSVIREVQGEETDGPSQPMAEKASIESRHRLRWHLGEAFAALRWHIAKDVRNLL